MGERKAVNKYYPPDWTPEQGSLDRYHGQHPLRERARKLNQGILIIRFEMPYNIWCGGCGNHIGMGVRYNAEKKKVGNYYTTPIYRFRMKCHLCDNHFEIETDPKNCDYVIVSGARRKEERWDPSATETVELTDREDAKKMATDAMYKLEHGVKDQQKSKAVQPTLDQLQVVQSIWKDDYAANQLLRKKFREQKHELKAQEMKDNDLKERGALDVALVPERLEDIELAGKIRYHGKGFDEHRRKQRFEVNSRPIFDSTKKSDERRDKIKQLLGKRKQMQLRSFSSPPKGNEAPFKLGIKVRRNRLANSAGLKRCSNEDLVNKDPTDEDLALQDCSRSYSRIRDLATNEPVINIDNARTEGNVHDFSFSIPGVLSPRTPETNTTNPTDLPFRVEEEVRSLPLSAKEHDASTSFSSKRKSEGNEACEDLLTKRRKNMSKDLPEVENRKTADVNGFSLLGSLVCCDYTGSSDTSDDSS